MYKKLFLGATMCILALTAAAQTTEILILPTIHTGHARNTNYSFTHVDRIIRNFRPDIIAVEIRPEDLGRDTTYLKKFYQPEMISAVKGYPGIRKAGIDFLGADLAGKPLPDNFNRDTVGDMGRFRLANQKLMRDTAIVKRRNDMGLAAIKTKQSQMMAGLSAAQLMDGSYNKLTEDFTVGQTALLKGTPYEYYDYFQVLRDTRIAENIRKVARENPGKRIIALTGANHYNRALKMIREERGLNVITSVNDQ